MLFDRTETQPLETVSIYDDAGEPITGIVDEGVVDEDLVVEIRLAGSAAWQTLTLTAGTVGTYAANTIAELGGGDYQLCLPASAIVSGKSTDVRLTFGTNKPQRDKLVARGGIDPATLAGPLADEIIPRLAGITITINSPSFSGATGSDLDVEQGDDYATRPARIDIVSTEDLTAYKYVLAARLPSNADAGLALEMTIREDEVGQFSLFAPTAEQTESWSIGTYELRHRIKIAANKYHTVKRGRLNVTPFDTPANAVDVDPPA